MCSNSSTLQYSNFDFYLLFCYSFHDPFHICCSYLYSFYIHYNGFLVIWSVNRHFNSNIINSIVVTVHNANFDIHYKEL